MKKNNIEDLNTSGVSYQVELVDNNCNAEIIEENINSLEEAEEKALNFINYGSNLSEHDKKESFVLISVICGSECNSVSQFDF